MPGWTGRLGIVRAALAVVYAAELAESFGARPAIAIVAFLVRKRVITPTTCPVRQIEISASAIVAGVCCTRILVIAIRIFRASSAADGIR